MNAVVQMLDHTPRSLVEERAIRPPIIGKIRPGIKVLTRAHQANEKAVKLYNDMVAAGDSYEAIGKVLETTLKLRNALVPKKRSVFRVQTLGLLQPGNCRRNPASLWRGSRPRRRSSTASRSCSLSMTGCATCRTKWRRTPPRGGSTSPNTTATASATARRMRRCSVTLGRNARADRSEVDLSYIGRTTTSRMASAIRTYARSIRTESAI